MRIALLITCFLIPFVAFTQSSIITQFIATTSDVTFDTVEQQERVIELKQINFTLEDVSALGSVELLLGSTQGASDYFQKSWNATADTTYTEADNTWFTREGILFSAGLGTWINREQAHLTLRIKSTSGSLLAEQQNLVY